MSPLSFITFMSNSKVFEFSGLTAIDSLDERWNGLSLISNSDNKYDLFAGTISGKIYHFEQTASMIWETATLINTVNEIQSLKHYDFDNDGKLEIITAEKTSTSNGEIRIHKPDNGITGSYSDTVLKTDRSYPQDILIYDIDDDGEMEIIYSYQGDQAGEGGLRYLDWDGVSDIMLSGSWTEYNMITHESAWWIAGIYDFNGNGKNILFSARDENRNAGAIPGIYYIWPESGVTNTWTRVTIDNTNADWLHLDVGDFLGNRSGKDIIASNMDNGSVYFYDFDNSFAKSSKIISANLAWNLKSLGKVFNGSYDTIISIHESNKAYLIDFINGDWETQDLWDTAVHPNDNEIIFVDLNHDGKKNIIIDDNKTAFARLFWFDIY